MVPAEAPRGGDRDLVAAPGGAAHRPPRRRLGGRDVDGELPAFTGLGLLLGPGLALLRACLCTVIDTGARARWRNVKNKQGAYTESIGI